MDARMHISIPWQTLSKALSRSSTTNLCSTISYGHTLRECGVHVVQGSISRLPNKESMLMRVELSMLVGPVVEAMVEVLCVCVCVNMEIVKSGSFQTQEVRNKDGGSVGVNVIK